MEKNDGGMLTETEVGLIKSQVLFYGLRLNKFSTSLAKRYDPSGKFTIPQEDYIAAWEYIKENVEKYIEQGLQ